MTTNTEVKYFASTMSGAPTLSGTAGTLISVLDACLVDGFGSVTLDSLVIASNVATGTISTGHNFAMVGATGPVIKIGGATPSGLNGEWRLASIPGNTTFTFATSGITDQTATGTITAKRAPAGFSKAFSGTNKAAYRANDITGTRLYLRINDDGTGSAAYARCVGYETMSDVDTGTNAFPTDTQRSGGAYLLKSNAASSTVRAWRLFADTHAFMLFCQYDGTDNSSFFFGDILSVVSTDAFHSLLIAHNNTSVNNDGLGLLNSAAIASMALARGYGQLGTAILPLSYGHFRHTNSLAQAGATYPNPADGGLILCDVNIWDNDTVLRGTLPGLYDPLHLHSNLTDGTIVSVALSGVTSDVFLQKMAESGTRKAVAAINLTGPWR